MNLVVWTCESMAWRSEEHTSELQSHLNLVCRLLLEKTKKQRASITQQCSRCRRDHSYGARQCCAPLPRIAPYHILLRLAALLHLSFFFFFNDTATTEIYTLPYTTLFRSHTHTLTTYSHSLSQAKVPLYTHPISD